MQKDKQEKQKPVSVKEQFPQGGIDPNRKNDFDYKTIPQGQGTQIRREDKTHFTTR